MKAMDVPFENNDESRPFSRSTSPFIASRGREFLLEQGFNSRYGARLLKRAIEHYVVTPLSNLIATNQIGDKDIIFVSRDEEGEELCFKKQPGSRSPSPDENTAASSSKRE